MSTNTMRAGAFLWILLLLWSGRGPDTSAVGQVTARADTQIYISPFEVLITASRMTIPLKENPAATSVVGRELLRIMPV